MTKLYDNSLGRNLISLSYSQFVYIKFECKKVINNVKNYYKQKNISHHLLLINFRNAMPQNIDI